MSIDNYTISTTLYDDAFSADQNYPDHSTSTLETQSVFTSTTHEHKLSDTLDPDKQRTDSNNDTCDVNSIFYNANNGSVGVLWQYKFKKAWLNNGDTTGINYTYSISPDNGWLSSTNNDTYIFFTGTTTNNLHAAEYELTVIATFRSNNTQADTFSTSFTILPNQPPTIGNIWGPSITVNYSVVVKWSNGNNVIQDPEGDALTITLYVDGVADPTWISIDPVTFGFSASPKNPDAGARVIKVSVEDGFNPTVNKTFILEVIENYDPDPKNGIISNIEVLQNKYFSTQLLTVNDYFSDPENRPMTASLLLYNGDPLPSFISYDSYNNTLSGTPTSDDVGDWLIANIATNNINYSYNISFIIRVWP